MIDWLVCVVPLLHDRINTGRMLAIDEDGQMKWTKEIKTSLEGTYSSNLQVVSNGCDENHKDLATHIYFSGNPNKFLAGHNVVGSTDIIKLTLFTVIRIVKLAIAPNQAQIEGSFCPISYYDGRMIPLTEFELKRILNGDFEVKLFDYNEYRQLPSQQDVELFINSFEYHARSLRERAERKDNTVYLQKRSRKWALKIYSKYNELLTGNKNHKLPNELESTPLLSFTHAKLRLEIRFLQEVKTIAKKYFNSDKLLGKHLEPAFIRFLFAEYWGRIKMNGQLELHNDDLEQLPTKLRAVHELWASGKDLKKLYSRATYYRHKADLLKHGIDISLRPVDLNKTNNVIPFVRIISAEPVIIPDNIQQYAIA